MQPGELFANPRRVDTVADMLANVWQLGYVTSDLDRAIDVMADRFGLTHTVKPWRAAPRLSVEIGRRHGRRVLRWARGGGLVVELIEPVSGAVDFYTRALPADGFVCGALPPLRGVDPDR